MPDGNPGHQFGRRSDVPERKEKDGPIHGATRRRTSLIGLLAAAGMVAAAQAASADSLLIQSLPASKGTPGAAVPGEGPAFKVFEDWQVTCPNRSTASAAAAAPEPCTMEPIPQAYSGSAGVTRLFGQMISLKPRTKPVPVFIVETRLGYLLPQGIGLKVDRHAGVRLAVRDCRSSGCIAPFRLTSSLKRRMTRGSRLVLTLKTLDAKTDATTVSLAGFASALNALTTGGAGLAAGK